MTGISGYRHTIDIKYELPAPPERVWRALTEPALLERWLMPNDIAPVLGHQFTFRTAPAPGFDGVVRCVVLQVVAPELLSYSWRGGQLDTTVTWRLNRTPAGGTELLLTQEGFGPEDGYTYEMLENGWREKAPDALRRVLDSIA